MREVVPPPGNAREGSREREAAEAPVRLRPMDAVDLAAVTDMWVEAWAAAYPLIDFDVRRPWFAAHMTALAESGARLTVALADKDVVGLVTLDPATGYLDQIVVSGRVQGRGVAELLLARARDLSPGSVTLDVNQDNARAVRFYRKQGFTIVAQGENARGAPTYRMRWSSPSAQEKTAPG